MLSIEQSEELLQKLLEDPRPLPGTELSNSRGHKAHCPLGEFCPLGVPLPEHEAISVPNCHVLGGGGRLPAPTGAGLRGPSLNTAFVSVQEGAPVVEVRLSASLEVPERLGPSLTPQRSVHGRCVQPAAWAGWSADVYGLSARAGRSGLGYTPVIQRCVTHHPTAWWHKARSLLLSSWILGDRNLNAASYRWLVSAPQHLRS